jgi:hypothetical protein
MNNKIEDNTEIIKKTYRIKKNNGKNSFIKTKNNRIMLKVLQTIYFD